MTDWGPRHRYRAGYQDRQAADLFTIRDDCFETTLKVDYDRLGFRRCADRAADVCFDGPRLCRNDANAVLLQILPGQRVEGRIAACSLEPGCRLSARRSSE